MKQFLFFFIRMSDNLRSSVIKRLILTGVYFSMLNTLFIFLKIKRSKNPLINWWTFNLWFKSIFINVIYWNLFWQNQIQGFIFLTTLILFFILIFPQWQPINIFKLGPFIPIIITLYKCYSAISFHILFHIQIPLLIYFLIFCLLFKHLLLIKTFIYLQACFLFYLLFLACWICLNFEI